MKRWQKSIGLLFTFMTAGLGCTYRTVDRPVTVTTKQLPEASKPEVVRAAKEVSGQSCNRVVLLFIPVGFATAERAYAEALAQAPGADTLINYEARVTHVGALPFYYQICTEVHGFALSSKQFVASAEDKAAATATIEHWQDKWNAEKRETLVASRGSSR